MSPVRPIELDQTAALACALKEGADCGACGVALLEGADSWQAHETGKIVLPNTNEQQVIAVMYDDRGAPYALSSDGLEDTRMLISLSDEDERIACAWACIEPQSELLGLGIDLVSRSDFGVRPGTERFIRLLFTKREQELAQELSPDDLPFAFSVLFGAKEASFKACAAPLRRWYEHHEEELSFDLRHFCMERPGFERGDARDGAAQRALDILGIRELRVYWRVVHGDALVVTAAIGAAD